MDEIKNKIYNIAGLNARLRNIKLKEAPRVNALIKLSLVAEGDSLNVATHFKQEDLFELLSLILEPMDPVDVIDVNEIDEAVAVEVVADFFYTKISSSQRSTLALRSLTAELRTPLKKQDD